MPKRRAVSPRPLAGSQPRLTLNAMISIRPTQNVGSEKPTTLPVMSRRDTGWRGYNPANSPSGTPITTAMISAENASSSVAGRRCRISWMAGSL